ncbi:hypothetical protein EB796_010362 [Bugula neritina]|uniref:Protein transport protein Sec61 subunit beta n=1 Tax=Bugula neritina TaxID=10212 RepID=A0A7J7JY51_BUGNE|nr:hypothetical protein EB796_010362 [Bugula neritina]
MAVPSASSTKVGAGDSNTRTVVSRGGGGSTVRQRKSGTTTKKSMPGGGSGGGAGMWKFYSEDSQALKCMYLLG